VPEQAAALPPPGRHHGGSRRYPAGASSGSTQRQACRAPGHPVESPFDVVDDPISESTHVPPRGTFSKRPTVAGMGLDPGMPLVGIGGSENARITGQSPSGSAPHVRRLHLFAGVRSAPLLAGELGKNVGGGPSTVLDRCASATRRCLSGLAPGERARMSPYSVGPDAAPTLAHQDSNLRPSGPQTAQATR